MAIRDKETIKKMFDGISESYDKLNDIMTLNQHRNIKNAILSNISLKDGASVLDVCSGTGDIAINIAKSRPDSQVIGIDFSEKMLILAKEKAKDLNNIKFQAGDAMKLEFEDNKFDACTIGFGLRNVEDLETALDEMIRVTKPGGYIVNLDTGKPKWVLKPIFEIFFFKIIPVIGKLFHGDTSPYKYLPESTKDFPSQDELVKIFKAKNLTNVRKYDFLFGAISMQIGEKAH